MPRQYKIGERRGMLTITKVSKAAGVGPRKITMIRCLCDCGKIISYKQEDFIRKRTCGCKYGNSRYGDYDTKVYSTWRAVKKRCLWEECPNYSDYGGRGITICEGFLDFNLFYSTIGLPPTKKHSVDRVDNNGNYSCGKCSQCLRSGWPLNIRWATSKEQASNKRNNYRVNLGGEIVTLKEACRRKNQPYKQVHERIKRGGWDISIAINTPVVRSKWIRYKNIQK
jgi:hypothetical protein